MEKEPGGEVSAPLGCGQVSVRCRGVTAATVADLWSLDSSTESLRSFHPSVTLDWTDAVH